jgi:hypothetical protein
MEGHQARILARIWDDPEWCALPYEAQWLYQSGLSQREINACGILPLRESRWATLAADTDTDVIASAMKRLIDTRFWIVDTETGEALYRSYMRTLRAWQGPNQLKAACAAAGAARGPAIRAAVLRELLRFPVDKVKSLNPARKGHRRPWLVYVETVAALRGDSPDGATRDAPSSDEPELGQMELDAGPFGPNGLPNGLPQDVGQLTSHVAPVIPIAGGYALGSTDDTTTPGLPKGLPNHKNYVVGGTASHLGSTTSVVTHTARERTPSDASADRSAPVVDIPPLFPPDCTTDPDEAAAIMLSRRRRREDRSLLNKAGLHGRALGLVTELTVDWPFPPAGRVRQQWLVAVSELLKNGIPEAVIAEGIDECRRTHGPGALASFVYQVANKGAPKTRGDRRIEAVDSLHREDGGPGLAAFVPNMLGHAPPREIEGTRNE